MLSRIAAIDLLLGMAVSATQALAQGARDVQQIQPSGHFAMTPMR